MKKRLTVGVAILVFLVIAGGLVAVNFKKSLPLVSPMGLGPTPTAGAKLLAWEDPAGFKFSYPAEVKINPHPEDKVNYANLDLTNSAMAGGIKILVQDNIYKNLDDWAKKQQTAGGQVLDSTLGDKPAKKAIFTTPSKIMIATIDAEALVLLEENLGEGDYWTTVFNDLVASFEFIPLASEPTKPAAKSGSSGGSGVIDEGEEIIE